MNQKQIQKNKVDEFIEILNDYKNENKISNWKINIFEKNKSNIYIESNYTIESILNSKREEIFFTIYKEFEDGTMGESSFNIDSDTNKSDFNSELDDAIFICSQSKSRKYFLPSADDESVKDDKIDYDIFCDKRFKEDFKSKTLSIFFAEKIEILKRLIKDKSSDKLSLKVNNIEVLNSLSETSIITSKGINKSFEKNSSYIELVITAINKINNKETEFVVYEKMGDIYLFDFEKFFSNIIKSAIDTSKENKAKDFKGKVILNENATIDFFNPDLTMNSIIGHASARLNFLGISNYKKDNEVIKNSKFDKLTIHSNPFVENSSFSSPYDNDGISGKRICLIENNIFKNYFASKQYADYLEINPTGPFGIIEVKVGNKTIEELTTDKDEIIEIISFASFVPDLISGDFSAEIRLGYKIKDGIKTPFKGGLFSGNIFKVLEEVELSKETINAKGYLGPKNIKFNNAEIIGL